MKDRVTEALKRTFRPEFLNRLDGMMVFRNLTKEQIRDIVDLELNRVHEQLAEQDDHARDRPTKSRTTWPTTGYDADYGARPLRRVIQDKLEDRLSEAMLSGAVKAGSKVRVTLGENKDLLFDVEHAVTITPPPPAIVEATEELAN